MSLEENQSLSQQAAAGADLIAYFLNQGASREQAEELAMREITSRMLNDPARQEKLDKEGRLTKEERRLAKELSVSRGISIRDARKLVQASRDGSRKAGDIDNDEVLKAIEAQTKKADRDLTTTKRGSDVEFRQATGDTYDNVDATEDYNYQAPAQRVEYGVDQADFQNTREEDRDYSTGRRKSDEEDIKFKIPFKLQKKDEKGKDQYVDKDTPIPDDPEEKEAAKMQAFGIYGKDDESFKGPQITERVGEDGKVRKIRDYSVRDIAGNIIGYSASGLTSLKSEDGKRLIQRPYAGGRDNIDAITVSPHRVKVDAINKVEAAIKAGEISREEGNEVIRRIKPTVDATTRNRLEREEAREVAELDRRRRQGELTDEVLLGRLIDLDRQKAASLERSATSGILSNPEGNVFEDERYRRSAASSDPIARAVANRSVTSGPYQAQPVESSLNVAAPGFIALTQEEIDNYTQQLIAGSEEISSSIAWCS